MEDFVKESPKAPHPYRIMRKWVYLGPADVVFGLIRRLYPLPRIRRLVNPAYRESLGVRHETPDGC